MDYESLNRQRKILDLCIKVAEINCLISIPQITISTIKNDFPDIFSLIALGVNLGFLSYDAYQVYSLEKSSKHDEKTNSKRLVKTNN